jgi:hypothetical protein
MISSHFQSLLHFPNKTLKLSFTIQWVERRLSLSDGLLVNAFQHTKTTTLWMEKNILILTFLDIFNSYEFG